MHFAFCKIEQAQMIESSRAVVVRLVEIRIQFKGKAAFFDCACPIVFNGRDGGQSLVRLGKLWVLRERRLLFPSRPTTPFPAR